VWGGKGGGDFPHTLSHAETGGPLKPNHSTVGALSYRMGLWTGLACTASVQALLMSLTVFK
jgi:hypothetical protein